MAANEIVFRVKVEKDGNLKVTAKEADAAAKSTKGLGKETDKLNNKRSNYQKVEKGVGQAGLSTAKGFSKQASTITGGLVPAYAILAANIFAITAAFSALQNAAQVEVLEQGFAKLGNAVGRTSSLMAKALKEVTDGAISTEEALKASAAGFNAGFTIKEMEGLAKIARGASIALGRDLGDALDRLIRGTAKLEPEILDELGLFIRLDDAAEKYAGTLGKTANELTNVERRAAFLNEALEQGARKFSLVADADVNVFNQMSATFRELAESFLQIVNIAVVPFMQLLAANTIILIGGVILLANGILKALVPALIKFGDATKFNSSLLKVAGTELKTVASEATNAAASLLKASKTKINDKNGLFATLMGKAGKGKASAAELGALDKLYKKSISIRMGALKKLTGAEAAAASARLAAMKAEQAAIRQTITEIAAKEAILKSEGSIKAAAASYKQLDKSLRLASDGTLGFIPSIVLVTRKVKENAKAVMATVFANNALNKDLSSWAKWRNVVVGAFSIVAAAARALGVVIATFLPQISLLIIGAGLLVFAFKALFSTTSAVKGPMEDLDVIMDTMPDKFSQLSGFVDESNARLTDLNSTLETSQERGLQVSATFDVLSGVLTESQGAFEDLAKSFETLDMGPFKTVVMFLENEFAGAINSVKDAWQGLKDIIPENLFKGLMDKAMYTLFGELPRLIDDASESIEDMVGGPEEVKAEKLALTARSIFENIAAGFAEVKGLENPTGLLAMVFGKGIETGGDFERSMEGLVEAAMKLDPALTRAAAKTQVYTDVMKGSKDKADALKDAAAGLGEAFLEVGTKFQKSFAKLRKQSEFSELQSSLAGLQARLISSKELLGDEGENVRNAMFREYGPAFAKLGIDIKAVAEGGVTSFDALKGTIDEIVEAEIMAASQAKVLGESLKQLKIADTLRKTNREMSQLLTSYSKTGKLVTTQAQKSKNITDDLIAQDNLLTEQGTKRKEIVGLETKLAELKIRAAMLDLDPEGAVYKNLELQLQAITDIQTAKIATINAEIAGQRRLNKLKGLTSMGSAPSSANSEIRGAKGAGKRMGIFTDNLAAGTYDTKISDEDKAEMTPGQLKGIKIGDMRAKLEGFKAVQEEMMESMR